MSSPFVRKLCSTAILAGFAVASQAGVQTFFEDNTSVGTGFLATPIINGTVDAAVTNTIANFNSGLINTSRYEFEGATPANATAGTGTGTTRTIALGGSAEFCGELYTGLPNACPGANFVGRYNTTAGLGPNDRGNWIETTSVGATSGLLQADTTFSLTFSSAINAFGAFGTDFYDFLGTVSYELFSGANEVEDVGAGRTIATQNNQNGGLLFFGLRSDTAFDRIVFRIVQSAPETDDYDFVGFDSVLVGNLQSTPPNDTPEPATLALVGLSLLGAGAASRRRRQKA